MSCTTTDAGRTTGLILVVEDDRALRDGLAMNLRLQGYEVAAVADGEDGLRQAFDARPDLIVLDLMLPGLSGTEILQTLRSRGESVPVLILSARNTTQDKVSGLMQGADDYMTKPFDLSELVARIEVMLRRQRTRVENLPVLSFGDVAIDQTARRVRRGNQDLTLSAKEFDLLCLLAGSPNRVFDRETILEKVWGWDYEGTARTVDNFVAGLRKKIEPRRRGPKYIRTVPGIGYTLRIQD